MADLKKAQRFLAPFLFGGWTAELAQWSHSAVRGEEKA